jgi:hypothetical protein
VASQRLIPSVRLAPSLIGSGNQGGEETASGEVGLTTHDLPEGSDGDGWYGSKGCDPADSGVYPAAPGRPARPGVRAR